jgi:hypothetical protein
LGTKVDMKSKLFKQVVGTITILVVTKIVDKIRKSKGKKKK